MVGCCHAAWGFLGGRLTLGKEGQQGEAGSPSVAGLRGGATSVVRHGPDREFVSRSAIEDAAGALLADALDEDLAADAEAATGPAGKVDAPELGQGAQYGTNIRSSEHITGKCRPVRRLIGKAPKPVGTGSPILEISPDKVLQRHQSSPAVVAGLIQVSKNV